MKRAVWRHALVPVLALLAIWLPAILQGHFWAEGDGLIEMFPQRRIAAWALAHGEFPFWNPYLFGGMPLFAAIQPGVLSPFNWPGMCLGPVAGENLSMAIALALLMSGCAAYARALALSPAAAALAAVAFPLGGFITSYMGSLGILQAAGLTAWLLWALERHARAGRRRYLAAVAACAAGMIFAGHPQTAAYGLVLAGLYALSLGGGPVNLATRGAALGLGLGMALVQLLPTLDLIQASQRHHVDYAWLTSHSLSVQGLPGLLFPSFFGSRMPSALFPVPLWARAGWMESLEAYVGPVVWLLALTALGRLRERAVRFWAACAGVGLLLSLGSHTPLYRLWALLPFLNQMPYASRHGFEESFALTVLAAYGLSWLGEAPEAARRALNRAGLALGVAMGAFVLAVGVLGPGFAARTQPLVNQGTAGLSLATALSPTQPAFWWPLLLLALAWGLATRRPALVSVLLALDLWGFHFHQAGLYQLPQAPERLAVTPDIDWHAGRSLTVTARRYPFEAGVDELALVRRLHYPDWTMLAGEPTINGYDAFLPRRYGPLFGMDSFGHAGEFDASLWEPPHHALDLMGLQTLRLEPAVAAQPAWQARLADARWERLPDEDGLVVLNNRAAWPHAWRVQRARRLDEAAVDAAVAGRAMLEPGAEALIETDLAGKRYTPGPAKLDSRSLDRMTLTTDGAGPGLVVLGSGYDAGWQAWTATGQALPVLRADAILTAVEVPAGPQQITLVYEPVRWRLGLGLSLGALLALVLGLLLLPFVHKRVAGAAQVDPGDVGH